MTGCLTSLPILYGPQYVSGLGHQELADTTTKTTLASVLAYRFWFYAFLIPSLIPFSYFFCQSNNLKYFYILSLKTCFNILSITSSILYQENFFTHPVQHIVRCEIPTIVLRKYVTSPEVLCRAGNFYISSRSSMFYKPTFSLSCSVSSCLFRVSLEKFLLYLA